MAWFATARCRNAAIRAGDQGYNLRRRRMLRPLSGYPESCRPRGGGALNREIAHLNDNLISRTSKVRVTCAGLETTPTPFELRVLRATSKRELARALPTSVRGRVLAAPDRVRLFQISSMTEGVKASGAVQNLFSGDRSAS